MTMQINSVDSSFTVCFNFFVGSKAERVQLFSLSHLRVRSVIKKPKNVTSMFDGNHGEV